MSKHSKNNTARGFFTYEEKKKLKYGTIRQRLGRDSLRNFDSCFLCLQTAQNPLSCTEGHIACKECLYENIMAQKTEAQRLAKLYEAQESLEEREQRANEEKEKADEIARFQKTQTRVGLESAQNGTSAKRTDAVARLRTDPKQISSFWIPSKVPSAEVGKLKKPNKAETICMATDKVHTISLKKLIEVKFHTTAGEKLNGQKIDEKLCPSCTKTLNNGIKCILLRTCGHVFCKSCSDQFVKPSLKCQSCEETCKEQDLILLSGGEGTGYVSGGGKVQAEKTMEAFQ